MSLAEKIGEGLSTFVAVVLVAFILHLLLIWFPVKLWAEAKCLKYGWRETQVTIALKCYCVREEDEWEIVRPLSEIIAESSGQ